MGIISKVINTISKIIGYINQSIAAIGITLGVTIAFVNVFARYVFDASLTWASELTIFCFLWSVFFAAAYCFKKDAHISITVVLDIVPSRVAKVMLLISHLVTFVFLCSVTYFGYLWVLETMEWGETSIDLYIFAVNFSPFSIEKIPLPQWIPFSVIPIAFAFSAFRVAERIHAILSTSHDKILAESEAEHVLSEMGIGALRNKDNENVQELNKMVKEVEKKTGGLL